MASRGSADWLALTPALACAATAIVLAWIYVEKYPAIAAADLTPTSIEAGDLQAVSSHTGGFHRRESNARQLAVGIVVSLILVAYHASTLTAWSARSSSRRIQVVRSRFALGAALVAGAFLMAACSSRPIPLSVVPGTTFILPVTNTLYGNQVSKGKGVQDYQRGDLIVALCPTSNPSCTPPVNQAPCNQGLSGVYLKTHWVTDVMPSPASNVGLAGRIQNDSYAPPVGLMGQTLAFLDVPPETCPGQYAMSLRSRPAGQSGPEGNLGQAWNITVANAPAGAADPNEVTLGAGMGWDVSQNMADMVPNPTAHLRLTDPGFYPAFPAAAEVDVTYPSSLVQILGAYQQKHLGLRSMLDWTDNGTGTVHLSLVDPTRCTEDIQIVFKLKTTTPVNTTTDFAIASQRQYDLNGTQISGNPYVVGGAWSNGPGCPSS